MQIPSMFGRRGTAGVLIALAVAATALGTASTAAASTPTSDSLPQAKGGSILYSVLSDSSSVYTSAKSTSLSIPADSPVTWFADRPQRSAGTTTARRLIGGWKANGFDVTPPNAAIVVTRDGQTSQSVVTLTRPQINGDVVTFTLKPLAGKTAVLGMSKSGASVSAGSYGGTEIFIDSGSTVQCGAYQASLSLDSDQQILIITVTDSTGAQVSQFPAKIASRPTGSTPYGIGYSPSNGLFCR